MRRLTFLTVIALVVAMIFVPTIGFATQAPQGTLVIMYAYAPEGVLLRSKLQQLTWRNDVMGRVDQGILEGLPVTLLPSGVGLVNAAAATQRVIDRFQPTWMIFSGIAGGIEQDNHVGDIVVPEKWATHDFGNVDKAGFTPRVIRVPTQPHTDVPWGRTFVTWYSVDSTLLKVSQASTTVARQDLKPVLGRIPTISVGGSAVSGNTFVDQVELRQFLNKTFTARTRGYGVVRFHASLQDERG